MAERLHFKKNSTSFIILADYHSKIIGIYENKKMSEVLDIVKKHPAIADFKISEGLEELGNLKIGKRIPFSSEDIATMKFALNSPPKFYLLFIRNKVDPSFCPYYECGVQVEDIANRGGIFKELNPDKLRLIEKLGLNPSQVARGEITAIIISDGDFNVLAIYPDTDMRDLKMILNRHFPYLHGS
jgi:hypothetical protein